jgi:hypothetical protein
MMETTVAIKMNDTPTGYNLEAIKQRLEQLLQQQLDASAFEWLKNKAVQADVTAQLNLAFAAIPRKMGKATVVLSEEAEKELHQLRPHFIIKGWSLERLARVWLLLHLNASNREDYIRTIEALFLTAEMNEQVALYSALPLLAYPEHWRKRCAEGIRSNIGSVLQAIMCKNPYPSENLEPAAWNQMVLKAFFTEKPVQEIIGLEERANGELAQILSDYAHERWAAHRPVNPLLWRCVAGFLDEKIFPDIEKLAASENEQERKAAVLVCRQSKYPPAKELLNTHPALFSLKENAGLSWNDLAG